MIARVCILIVDEEPQTQKLLRVALASEGYRTIEARSAEEAMQSANSRKSDLVLLDLDLPDADGTHVIRSLREWSRKPIIVISARQGETDKVKALEIGADDYITKPFSTGELMARIRVALRHDALASSTPPHPPLEAGDFRIDLERRTVHVGRRELHLTPREYDLLAYFVKHAGKVITHPQLIKEVWGAAYPEQRGHLRVYIAQLRRKLEHDPARPRYILTEPGVGYLLRVDRC